MIIYNLATIIISVNSLSSLLATTQSFTYTNNNHYQNYNNGNFMSHNSRTTTKLYAITKPREESSSAASNENDNNDSKPPPLGLNFDNEVAPGNEVEWPILLNKKPTTKSDDNDTGKKGLSIVDTSNDIREDINSVNSVEDDDSIMSTEDIDKIRQNFGAPKMLISDEEDVNTPTLSSSIPQQQQQQQTNAEDTSTVPEDLSTAPEDTSDITASYYNKLVVEEDISENTIDDIANMLIEKPPTLRQLREGSLLSSSKQPQKKKTEGRVDINEAVQVSINTDKRRERLKARAAELNLQRLRDVRKKEAESEKEEEKKEEVVALEDEVELQEEDGDMKEDVAQELLEEEDVGIEDVADTVEEEEVATEDIVDTIPAVEEDIITTASPTRSIKEEYTQLKQQSETPWEQSKYLPWSLGRTDNFDPTYTSNKVPEFNKFLPWSNDDGLGDEDDLILDKDEVTSDLVKLTTAAVAASLGAVVDDEDVEESIVEEEDTESEQIEAAVDDNGEDEPIVESPVDDDNEEDEARALFQATLEEEDDEDETSAIVMEKVLTPGEKAMNQYESINVTSTMVYSKDGIALVDPIPKQSSDVEVMEETPVDSDKEEDEENNEAPDDDTNPVLSAINEAPSFESMFAAAKALLPKPPPMPPTQEEIDNNSDTANENLSEINLQMQTTLTNQRKDLGRLRKKVNDVERELQRAKRTKRSEINNEIEAETASLKERYARQLKEAKDKISSLEKQTRDMEQELQDGKVKLEETVEAKERVAADYFFAVKTYTDFQGTVDSQTKDMSAKLDKSQQEITALESLLSNTTEQMNEYQAEAQRWKDECSNKANQLDTFTTRVVNMQKTIDELQNGINNTQSNLEQVIQTTKDEEKERSKANLQTLSDEYERLLSKKSKKIGQLRVALRTANQKKRRVERYAEKEKSLAMKKLRGKLNGEINALKGELKEREGEIEGMRGTVKEAEAIKEEREQLLAEIMFLSKSFEELQAELKSNTESYEDSIKTYEAEAAEKERRIVQLEVELETANKRIVELEYRIEELITEVEKEKSINAGLKVNVSELQDELKRAQTNAGNFDKVESILRKEVETYKAQLSEANAESTSQKQKKAELEELISKTKDSLVDEKSRVADALSEKDTRIAQLDRELAEKYDEIRTTKASLDDTTRQLTKMTNDYNSQKGRANALDKKIQKLNQVTSGGTSEEVDRLTSLLEDITKSNEEYKSLMATYEDKSKFLSQQLLLSGQNVSTKQSQIEKLRQELEDTSSRKQVVVEDKKSETAEISDLRTKLNEVQTKSTKWKAQANGMIVQLQDDLKEKNQSMAQMQEQLDELSKEQQPPPEQSSSSGNEALEKEIAELKSAMEDAQTKAKERMKDKNQSLKELEDSVAKLSAEMIDLRRDKDQITKRLNEEIQRGKDVYQIHDRQLKETEDKLAKQNIADMRNLEAEMSATIHDLEREVKSLQDQANSPPPVVKMPTVQSTNMEYEKVKRMQEELRRSREVEVSLLNDNMKMKKRLDALAKETYSPPKPAKVFDDESTNKVKKESVELPKYYKEKQRPAVIRVVKNTWNKLFRRKKL